MKFLLLLAAFAFASIIPPSDAVAAPEGYDLFARAAKKSAKKANSSKLKAELAKCKKALKASTGK